MARVIAACPCLADRIGRSGARGRTGRGDHAHRRGRSGEGDSGANKHDEPLFPIEVTYHSQPIAWVLGETQEAARLGAARVEAEYVPLTPILTIPDAIAAQSFHSGPFRIRRGDAAAEINGELLSI